MTSRFKGFDDDDNDQEDVKSLPGSISVDHLLAIEPQSQGLFVSQDAGMDMEQDASQVQSSQDLSSRKRAASPIEEEVEDIMEQIAPATTALKRRRLAEGKPSLPPRSAPEKSASKAPPKKVRKDIDVLEIARQQQEKVEALAKAERESIQEQMEGMDIEAIRNLAIVETIEVKRLMPTPRAHARADESERWDDKWNGRKNFKKFRRRGAAGSNTRDINRVIVPLEEVKKKDFGIGDDYWLESDTHRKQRKGKGRDVLDTSQSQSQPKPKTGAAGNVVEITANEFEEEFVQAQDTNEERASDAEPVEARNTPAAPAPSERSQKLVDKTSTSRNIPAQNKRAASTMLTKPAPAKKVRQAIIRKDESDDSEDELKFRFRKRN